MQGIHLNLGFLRGFNTLRFLTMPWPVSWMDQLGWRPWGVPSSYCCATQRNMFKTTHTTHRRGIPGSPMVKILCPQHRGTGSIPGQGTMILYAARCWQRNKKTMPRNSAHWAELWAMVLALKRPINKYPVTFSLIQGSLGCYLAAGCLDSQVSFLRIPL